MEEVLILKEVFSRSGHLHSFGEGYHRQIFLVFVSPLCIQAAHFLGVHVMYVTQVCMHTGFSGVNGNTHTHTHTHIKLAYSSLCSLFLPPHLLS